MLEQEYTEWGCATNAQMAADRAGMFIEVRPEVWRYRAKNCVDTGSAHPQIAEPSLTVERVCDAAPEDDGCVSCTKTSCCDEYSACTGDASCVCWVDCLSSGNEPALCSLPERCGSLGGVAAALSTCVDSACQAYCPTPGSLGGAGTHLSAGSGPSGGVGAPDGASGGGVP